MGVRMLVGMVMHMRMLVGVGMPVMGMLVGVLVGVLVGMGVVMGMTGFVIDVHNDLLDSFFFHYKRYCLSCQNKYFCQISPGYGCGK